MSNSSPYLRLLAIAVFLNDISFTTSFSPSAGSLQPRLLESAFLQNIRPRHRRTSCSLSAGDDEVARQIAKAKEILATAKAKMAKKEEEDAKKESDDDVAMFFASSSSPEKTTDNKRERVVKTKNEDSGLITTDGELMAALSESEKWEARPLAQVFDKNELKDKDDASRKKFERDIAQSMWNLKKTMKKEDYEAIFDKRNFFIGEEN